MYEFFVCFSGEVKYGKNGHQIAILMFVDKTLPLWAFFDVYGSTQKIKVLGKVIRGQRPSQKVKGSGTNSKKSMGTATKQHKILPFTYDYGTDFHFFLTTALQLIISLMSRPL